MPIIGFHLNPVVLQIIQKNISHSSQNKNTQNTHTRNMHKNDTLTSPPIQSKEITIHPIHLCLIESCVKITRIRIWHRHQNCISPQQYPFLRIRSHLESGPRAPPPNVTPQVANKEHLSGTFFISLISRGQS